MLSPITTSPPLESGTVVVLKITDFKATQLSLTVPTDLSPDSDLERALRRIPRRLIPVTVNLPSYGRTTIVSITPPEKLPAAV